MITRCAVLGSPIGHSLSPVLHRAAYAALGLTDWRYDAFEVDDEGLGRFVAELDASWRGLSMTKPLKFAALELGVADDQVRLSGAANTMIIDPDGTRRLHNTDIGGLTAALRSAGLGSAGLGTAEKGNAGMTRVAVLGAGGTTRAALVSVAALGARSVTVLARRPEQAASLAGLADELGLELVPAGWETPVPACDLLISTVGADAAAPRAAQALDGAAALFDVIYDPWPTPLAAAAVEREIPVINGLDLLVHQAVGQVELMTGQTVSAQTLMSAGRKALSERGL